MGGSSGGGGTTTTKSDPWDEQKPFLTYGFNQAQDQFKSGTPQYYPNQTVAPQSQTTQQALDLTQQRALNGSPVTAAGNQLATDTMKGNYLNSNPFLDASFNAGARQIGNSYNSLVNQQKGGFEAGGRYGSGMQQFAQNQANDTLGQNLGDLAARTYGANYQQERANQLGVLGQSPALANQDYTNLDALSNVGASRDQYAQTQTDADIDKWNYNQNLPANKLGQYMGLIQGNYGGTSSTQTPRSGSNMFGQILGGLGTAASVAGMFSDRRLKTNIKRVGTADNGLPIYMFNYVGIRLPLVGLMADEVEKVHPNAITLHSSGYAMVDYGLALMPVRGEA